MLGQTGSKVHGTKSQDELYQKAAEEYGAALDRLAHAYEANPDRRRDLLQEIHLALWRSFEKFEGRCSLRTWIYRVSHNVAQPDQDSVEMSADRQQSLTRLLALIHRLEPVDRQLMLVYLEGVDTESIAEITGLSKANVWTKIHRIKNVLIRQFHAGGAHGR